MSFKTGNEDFKGKKTTCSCGEKYKFENIIVKQIVGIDKSGFWFNCLKCKSTMLIVRSKK